MKAPKFWDRNGLLPQLLAPASFFYKNATASRVKQPGYKSKLPVVCIGNIVAGGAGKTPTAIALAEALGKQGHKPHIISRGYGGSFEGVVKVAEQSPKVVGDEPILLSQAAPTWVAESRVEAARAAEESGAGLILMDDGFQNPELEKDFSLIVIDGGYGLGNGRVIPAGPLRETAAEAEKRADAVLVIGKQKKPLPQFNLPVFKARIEIDYDPILKEETLIAFCGIGRPDKFFESLQERGLNVVEALEFADHHFYTEDDFREIFKIANSKGAVVVTTEKDMVKVPARFHKLVYPIKATLKIENEDELVELIGKKIKS